RVEASLNNAGLIRSRVLNLALNQSASRPAGGRRGWLRAYGGGYVALLLFLCLNRGVSGQRQLGRRECRRRERLRLGEVQNPALTLLGLQFVVLDPRQ